MGDLEIDTRLEAMGESDGVRARYRGVLSQDWEIWGPNGGYLAVIALRAMGREAAIPRPVAFAAHFLGVGSFGPVELEVEALRRGRRSESFRVSMRQEGRTLLEAMMRTAAEGAGLAHRFGAAPSVPAPEDLPTPADLATGKGPSYPFWQNLEARVCQPERFAPVEEGAAPPARDPVWREWYRFRPRALFDDPFLEAGRALVLLDTLSWPAACQPHPDAPYQAPNLDVAAWFHEAAPDSEWLLADHACPIAAGGLMGTGGRVWSRDGRLLASGGAQLLCVPVAGG